MIDFDDLDADNRSVSGELLQLTRQQVEEQLILIVNDRRPTTHAGDLIDHPYGLVAPPTLAG